MCIIAIIHQRDERVLIWQRHYYNHEIECHRYNSLYFGDITYDFLSRILERITEKYKNCKMHLQMQH